LRSLLPSPLSFLLPFYTVDMKILFTSLHIFLLLHLVNIFDIIWNGSKHTDVTESGLRKQAGKWGFGIGSPTK
jgi:hypothetical protein